MQSGAVSGRMSRQSARVMRLAVLSATIFALAAPSAHATLRVVSHNDPAGDPTLMTYRLLQPPNPNPLVPDFTLADGASRSFGVNPGTYVFQAVPPAGWHVTAIQCVGRNHPGEFTIDVPNARVTAVHEDKAHEQTCTFTSSKVVGSSSGPPSSGISPSVPPSEASKVKLPTGPALLRVRVGRGFASATVRVTRRSVIRCQLLRGRRVVGTARVTHQPGAYTIRVAVTRRQLRAMRRQGLKRVTLTLKVVTVADNKATHVFRYRVLVRL
jgi:hypothetical protein